MKILKGFSVALFFVLVLSLVYSFALADEAKEPVDVRTASSIKTKASANHDKAQSKPSSSEEKAPPLDLDYFKQHLKSGMTTSDVITVFGDNYRESLTEQSGEPSWTYDFPTDPHYQTSTPPYAVDEKGILTNKLRYQLNIVWNGDQMKSYIVFYNNNGTIGELKEKFFPGPYINE